MKKRVLPGVALAKFYKLLQRHVRNGPVNRRWEFNMKTKLILARFPKLGYHLARSLETSRTSVSLVSLNVIIQQLDSIEFERRRCLLYQQRRWIGRGEEAVGILCQPFVSMRLLAIFQRHLVLKEKTSQGCLPTLVNIYYALCRLCVPVLAKVLLMRPDKPRMLPAMYQRLFIEDWITFHGKLHQLFQSFIGSLTSMEVVKVLTSIFTLMAGVTALNIPQETKLLLLISPREDVQLAGKLLRKKAEIYLSAITQLQNFSFYDCVTLLNHFTSQKEVPEYLRIQVRRKTKVYLYEILCNHLYPTQLQKLEESRSRSMEVEARISRLRSRLEDQLAQLGERKVIVVLSAVLQMDHPFAQKIVISAIQTHRLLQKMDLPRLAQVLKVTIQSSGGSSRRKELVQCVLDSIQKSVSETQQDPARKLEWSCLPALMERVAQCATQGFNIYSIPRMLKTAIVDERKWASFSQREQMLIEESMCRMNMRDSLGRAAPKRLIGLL